MTTACACSPAGSATTSASVRTARTRTAASPPGPLPRANTEEVRDGFCEEVARRARKYWGPFH